ncbi:tyrosine-type recombinase/integrase [Rhodococcus aetherivorans]|uniref:tyrosine-type recombinase/integrase n=1 Tax=Rhodococcus aetherivorans TaxID=191292 RepID=UPI00369DF492
MTTLRENVADYLVMRRAMGFKAEALAKLLISFVRFCEARGVDHVTNDIALQWATSQITVPVHDGLFARRMDAVRLFARHRQTLDPTTQVPPETVCNRRYRPREPHIYNDAEVRALLAATETLSPQFTAATWRTLIGLLATTGMRPGEACRVSVDDVDLNNGVIQVLGTKFGKSRLVFLHPTTVTHLRHYLQVRRDHVPAATRACPMLFLNSRHTELDPNKLNVTFRKLLREAAITTVAGRRPPRLHDLRHTFAVTTMLRWYDDGHDVQARLPLLSTWLGHVDPASTYWYLHAVPELLGRAARRLETRDSGTAAGAQS